VDKRYEVYCLADALFYDAPGTVREIHTEFSRTRCPVPPGWERTELDDWLVHRPEDVRLPPQGWKVHVSACLDNAEDVLAAVWDHCVARGVAFKFLRDRNSLLLSNAKYAHRGSSGKLVTIYPVDEAELARVLTGLGEVLDGQPGPYILSDLRWRQGPLYVRYGGFAERFCASPSGALELAIEDADGVLVPDRRGPTFRLPEWVTLPEFLAPELAARNAVRVDEMAYAIERAIHFSNGGGLYAGTDTRTGEAVVLKEARPHAGLDLDGTDAVARLLRERDMLARLAGLPVVAAARDHFLLGDHHFLVLDFVDGTVLRNAIVDRYPLVGHDTTEQAVAEYTRWALAGQADLEQAVALIHERGVVLGDLHPNNVLLTLDGRLVLIDFETAAGVEEGRRQTLADPGFLAPRDRTGFDIDRYALACLRLFLFLPLTSLLALDPGKAAQLADVIAETFPVPRAFLDEAVATISGRPENGGRPESRRTPRRSVIEPDPDGWRQARESMSAAILASATPQRDDRLFPGDIEQFETGGLNLAHGAAGVLYALAVTGAGRYPQHEEWLLHRALHPESGGTTRLGCYDGLHGVAHVLHLLGHDSEARKVLDICAEELDGNQDRLGLDLYSGMSGIALNLLHFADVTGDESIRAAAHQAVAHVADRLGDEDAVGTLSGGDHPHAGLLRGSSGPALLFLRLYSQTGHEQLLDLAAVALRQDLRRCVLREDDASMQVNEGWRTMPYLADGSAGIGLVLDEYLSHRPDERFAAAAASIRRAAEAPFYVEPGLFWGRAGLITYLSHAHAPGTAAAVDPVVAAHVQRLAWHALDYQGHLAFPGEQLLRLSMDLATGTAGVLLAVGAALHDQPVTLPLLAPRDVRPATMPEPPRARPREGDHPHGTPRPAGNGRAHRRDAPGPRQEERREQGLRQQQRPELAALPQLIHGSERDAS